MRNFVLLITLLLIYTSNVFSQNNIGDRKNILFIEGAGALVAGLGGGYERYINMNKESMRLTARVGLGSVDNFSSFTTFMGSSFIWGNKSGVEIGLNYLINYDKAVFESIDEDEEQFGSDIQLLLGYRYQNWRNGLSFRVFYVPPVGCCGSYLPFYGGLSIAYAF